MRQPIANTISKRIRRLESWISIKERLYENACNNTKAINERIIHLTDSDKLQRNLSNRKHWNNRAFALLMEKDKLQAELNMLVMKYGNA